ncbi:immune inhibitor A domain-containing protein [Fictibacillus phosphorivorans]|uniref:immune inhibitor A domain-containing protein n=1 Tax=Fictibacillus phosphorivorans TaxID=1221500 RepID=UPI00203E5DAF|nr:immune inhibitor A [Fictibacillus phosphorivorans]MCM3775904.1 immune inhibitor A [Fictibacillus phosphorivorans]
MKKGKWVSAALAALLSCSTFASVSAAPVNVQSDAKTSPVEEKSLKHAGGPFDLAVANDEKLIEMLKKNGQISKNASETQAQAKLQQFLKNKQENAQSLPKGELEDKHAKHDEKGHKKHKKDGLKHGKKGKGKKDIKPVEEEKWTGDQRVDNVLVLLVEYPDFPASNITPEETDMYYANYSKEHYEDMIFGEDGYEGPNGEDLISVKEFYEQQSGGSYSITGKVGGWYQAKYPAAYYGGNDPAPDGSDANPRELVREALTAAANDPNIDLSEFDQEDRYDLDGDGNLREPDGLVDHLMIVHSSVGEEAGGGQLGGDAVWSHRWNLGDVFPMDGTEAEVPYWGGNMAAYDYTIEPADGAAGVFAHEYGHDLGLPDEYDTQYSGTGEPIAYWSIMSSGSWAGDIPGTEPTGFSAWSKEYLQSSMEGSNWLTGETFDLKELSPKGTEVLLDQANTKGTNHDAVRVDLPQKETVVNTPFSGAYEYHGGSGNNLDNDMITSVDLTNASSATLSFKAWYDIETDWDYASVQVKEEGSEAWVAIPGNITTDTDPHEQNPGHGITGKSDGWIDATFDLSAFAGKNIQVKLNYWTDVAAVNPGIYVDDVSVTVDGTQTLFDDAEGEPAFTLEGFKKDQGKFYSDHYYLLEWRNHEGVDEGLAHIRRGNSLMQYDGGLLVWYVDNSYSDNWTGIHPGDGFLGVVDANQETLKWSDKSVASSRYQIHDAAFSKKKSAKMFLDYRELLGLTLTDNKVNPTHKFNDKKDYSNPGMPDAGRDIPTFGLQFEVVGTSKDDSVAKIKLARR